MGLDERTNVIVVGAGASKEFALPVGSELLNDIKEFANVGWRSKGEFIGDRELAHAFIISANEKQRDSDDYFKAAAFIAKNMSIAPSIDNFLHTHKENQILVEVGKMLIARSIVEAEKKSSLYFDPLAGEHHLDFSRELTSVEPPNKTWLGELFRLLASGRNFDDFITALGNITFVSFNYDRCIEHFLMNAANQFFDCDEEQLQKVQGSLSVLHPYGSLGKLKIEFGSVSGFGRGDDALALCKAVSDIKTFTEGVGDHSAQELIQQAFSLCEIAIFLGFGFLPLNLERLFGTNRYEVNRVLGTGKGLSDESISIICSELKRTLLIGDHDDGLINLRLREAEKKISISNVSCFELFQKHNRFLVSNNWVPT